MLQNARSQTLRLLTDKQGAGARCNVGNSKLALDTWLGDADAGSSNDAGSGHFRRMGRNQERFQLWSVFHKKSYHAVGNESV